MCFAILEGFFFVFSLNFWRFMERKKSISLSATTKTLTKDHYAHAFMEEEIQRYTTLSYRAPEMIDLFSGIPIGNNVY